MIDFVIDDEGDYESSMTGSDRRQEILKNIKESDRPVSLETELCTIVDLGGQVKNVMVNHKVYGHIEAELGITSRRKVKEFLTDIESGKSTPLKNITSDYHYHTVTADSEETLGMIEEELRKLGFLVEN